MSASDDVWTVRIASLRRVAVLTLISIPVAAEVVLSEVLFAGHIVFLVETLGFVGGMATFIAVWAALGMAVLGARDSIWPRVVLQVDALRARLRRLLSETRIRLALIALGVSGVAVAVGLAVTLAGGDISDWVADHPTDILTFLIAAAVIAAVLMLIAALGRGFERWVRRVADTAGPAMRSFATLVSMALLGPALAWLLFRLLRFSRRSTYALTLASAPVFGAVWVPIYSLGVWGLLQDLL